MKKLNSQGFSPVEIILVIVVLGLAGFIGWTVYDRTTTKPDNAETTTQTTTTKPVTSESTDTFEDAVEEAYTGKVIVSGKKGFSITIPDGWNILRDIKSDFIMAGTPEDIVYTAEKKVTVMDSDGFGTDAPLRFVVSQVDDLKTYLGDYDYEKTTFKAGSLSGTRYYYREPLHELNELGPFPGAKNYHYVFQPAGKDTYVVSYEILESNKYTKSNLSESDTDQLEFIEKVVSTLEIK